MRGAGRLCARVLCAGVLCAGVSALNAGPASALDIVADYGGALAAYRAEARRLDASGEQLAIRGVCASACTIFLGLRRVCVAPGAVFWFHAARLPGAAAPDPLATLEMLSSYPPGLRDWAIRAHALERLEFDAAASLTGEEVIRLGARRCR